MKAIHFMTVEELEENPNIERLIRDDVCEWMTGMSRSTRYRRELDGEFPEKIDVGPRVTAYRLSDIQAWIKGEWKPK